MTADRIACSQIIAFLAARPDGPSRKALSTALHGINTAEQAMRETIATLRSALDDAELCLDAGRTYPDSPRIQYAATRFGHASTARDLHWATAAALLTGGELTGLVASDGD